MSLVLIGPSLYRREVTRVLRRHSGDLGVASAFTLIIESGSLYCVIWVSPLSCVSSVRLSDSFFLHFPLLRQSVLLAAYVTSNQTLDTTLLASVAILTVS